MRQLFLNGILLILILGTLNSYSQTISYGYDAAGNRISKTIPFKKSAFINSSEVNSQPEKEIVDDTFKNQSIKIYPNPTTGIIEIEIPENPDEPETVQILVLDMNGKLIIDRRQQPARTQIDLNGQPNGIYVLNLKKGSVISKWKIIKQ